MLSEERIQNIIRLARERGAVGTDEQLRRLLLAMEEHWETPDNA
jgi:hypothetical protein